MTDNAMTPQLRLSILLLTLCQALSNSTNVILVTTASLVGYTIAPDKAFATLPMAFQLAGTASATVPASAIMQRLGRRAGFMIGASCGIAGGLLGAWAIFEHQFYLFLGATTLVGISNGFSMYYRFAAADMAPATAKAKAISWVVAGGIIAAFAGPEIAKHTHDLIGGAEFAGTYFAIGLLPVITIMILMVVNITEPAADKSAEGGRDLGTLFRQRAFPVALFGSMIGYGSMAFIMTATPLAMQERGFDFGSTAFVIQWHVLGMFGPSLVTGHIIRRVGVLNVMLAGAILEIACVAINLTGTEMWQFWTALFCLGLGWNFLYVGGSSLLTECYRPEERSKVQALNEFSTFGTVAIASFSAGAANFWFGWDIVNISALPLLVLAALLIIALAFHRSRESRQAEAAGE
jgi:MFS family permease